MVFMLSQIGLALLSPSEFSQAAGLTINNHWVLLTQSGTDYNHSWDINVQEKTGLFVKQTTMQHRFNLNETLMISIQTLKVIIVYRVLAVNQKSKAVLSVWGTYGRLTAAVAFPILYLPETVRSRKKFDP